MFGCEEIGDVDGLIQRFHENGGGVARDGAGGDGRGGEHGELAIDFFGDGGGQAFGGGEEYGRGIDIVLGLREHVGG